MKTHVTLDPDLVRSARYRVLTVQAHADDETITMGGTMALCRQHGVATAVVCCTDGKRATIFDPSMPEKETRPKLAAIRQDELVAACTALGVSEVYFLNFGDSNMQGHEDNAAPDAFWQANLDLATGALVAVLREFRPHIVVTYNAYGSYGHPDHIQAHRVALLAVEAARHPLMYPDAGASWSVERLYYTAFPKSHMRAMIQEARKRGIEMPFGRDPDADHPMGTPDEEVTDTVDFQPVMSRKLSALLAHKSQIQPDWPMVTALSTPGAEALAKEYFTLVSRYPGADNAPALSDLATRSFEPA